MRSLVIIGCVGLTSLSLTSPVAAADAVPQLQPYVAHHPGSSPANVAYGDVTGDGRSDVLLTTDYDFDPVLDFGLWVYPQQPDGSLGAPTRVATSGTYGSDMAVAVADLDGDADLDAAVSTEAGIDIFAQEGGALAYTWTAPITEGRDLETVDVSGDGLADLVVNTQYGLRVWWQIAGDFMPAPTGAVLSSSFHTEVEVADLTGDGRADVATVSGSTLGVRAQNADHSFAAATAYPVVGLNGWDYANGLAVGDTNGDGRADVVVTAGGNKPNASIETRVQLADGTLGAAAVVPSYDIPEPAELADLNGDGRADLVTAHGGWNRVGVYAQQSGGGFSTESLFPVPYASHYDAKGLAVGDISGDGAADVLLADYNNGLIVLRGTVPPRADLAVTLTDAPDPVKRGGTLTYTTRVKNAGPAVAADVVVAQSLPPGFTFKSATLAGGTCTLVGATVRCSLPSLASGSVATVTVTGTVTLSKGTLPSSVSATTSTTESSLANNSATSATKIGNGR